MKSPPHRKPLPHHISQLPKLHQEKEFLTLINLIDNNNITRRKKNMHNPFLKVQSMDDIECKLGNLFYTNYRMDQNDFFNSIE